MYGIEASRGGGLTITGDGITVFQMLALESRLRMERSGIRFSPSARALAKRLFGLTGNREKVLADLIALRHKRFPQP